MANDRILWCIIQGDDTTFKVVVPVDADIDDLRELVKEKGISENQRILAKDLILWKASTSWMSA